MKRLAKTAKKGKGKEKHEKLQREGIKCTRERGEKRKEGKKEEGRKRANKGWKPYRSK